MSEAVITDRRDIRMIGKENSLWHPGIKKERQVIDEFPQKKISLKVTWGQAE